LLPTFEPVARALGPITRWIARPRGVAKRPEMAATSEEAINQATETTSANLETGEQQGLIEGEERRLLQSIVDFGNTLVREVMTPRPDIVAIQEDATIGDLRTLFREQEYSRFPVYRDSLDNIAGFVFIKDLVGLGPSADDRSPIKPVVRPASVVPETKRVPE